MKPQSFLKLIDLCPVTFMGAKRQGILRLLLGSGIRANELYRLNRNDLDWDRNRVRVIFSKGQKQRWAPFPDQTQAPMLRYLDFRTDNHACLWVTEERSPMGYYGFAQDMSRLMERAEIKGEVEDVMHIFRRTFGLPVSTPGCRGSL